MVLQIAEVTLMQAINRQSPLKALIADDDPISLMLLESLLVSLKIETYPVGDVAHARKMLTKMIPDIAILDVLLPDGDGVDILVTIRRSGQNRGLDRRADGQARRIESIS
jgi:CheY-like chemotaxis protein